MMSLAENKVVVPKDKYVETKFVFTETHAALNLI
jgi:hypothetical protein